MSPGVFASICASCGSTSRLTKSSAVSFIIRCSSVRPSGVSTVAEPVGSSRKPPPGDNVTVWPISDPLDVVPMRNTLGPNLRNDKTSTRPGLFA